jgi:electron-transferring-flavoprotein dehydrogenase
VSERDSLHYDVVIVGAGPAGLACALRLKALQPERSVCVLEKGATVGAHLLSGAVIDPAPLDALLPDWRATPPAIAVPVQRDEFRLLTAGGSLVLPVPPQQRNHGHFIVSLGQLMALLATRAEAAGVDVFPGFAVSHALEDAQGAVCGVVLGDMGRRRDGSEKPGFTPGAEVRAPVTVVAEGARGSLAKQLMARYALGEGHAAQTFALGFKELWQLPPGRSSPGLVQHCVGWPLDAGTYGGGFVYHLPQDRLYVGFVIGLDYRDPALDLYDVFQRFKGHPWIAPMLAQGTPQGYGARAIAAGGWQSLPRLEMPGALLVGDAAGTLNVARLKGVHQAMRCGMLAAEHLAQHGDASGFDARWRASSGHHELWRVRNIKPGFKRGLWLGLGNGILETLTQGHSPWTLTHGAQPWALQRLAARGGGADASPLPPPRDRSASVYLAGTTHEEDQPVHLKIRDPALCAGRCAREFGNPCTRFCPAGVYEMVADATAGARLQINAANCVHCKACDIKDPYQIIDWTVPEGGSGPNYQEL